MYQDSARSIYLILSKFSLVLEAELLAKSKIRVVGHDLTFVRLLVVCKNGGRNWKGGTCCVLRTHRLLQRLKIIY